MGRRFLACPDCMECEFVHAACFAMLAYIGHGGTLEPMLVVARAGLAASKL